MINQISNGPAPANTIEDSLRAGHQAAAHAASVLDSIWEDLTGNQPCGEDAAPYYGLITSAEQLASRISSLACRLEDVRGRLANPPKCAEGKPEVTWGSTFDQNAKNHTYPPKAY